MWNDGSYKHLNGKGRDWSLKEFDRLGRMDKGIV